MTCCPSLSYSLFCHCLSPPFLPLSLFNFLNNISSKITSNLLFSSVGLFLSFAFSLSNLASAIIIILHNQTTATTNQYLSKAMTTANPNNRASLLAGLRTGGVRTTSLNVPHTAAPTGAFAIPPFVSQHQNSIEEEDLFQELPQHTTYSNRSVSLTAAVDGPNNRFSHQQQARGMNPNSVPFTPSYPPMMPQAQLVQQNQAMQIQMLQLEMMRIQVV